MTERRSFALLGPEIAASAARYSAAYEEKVQEEVSWDLNMKSHDIRKAPYFFDLKIGGCIEIKQLNIATNEPGAPESSTGSSIWTASIGLARYLESKYSPDTTNMMTNMNCIELGCGTGLVSILMASLGAHVVATDINECLENHTKPNFNNNLVCLQELPIKGKLETRELVWGSTSLESFGNSWDLVIASDVIYRSEHSVQLFSTLQGLIGNNTICYVAFDRRGREGLETFFQLIQNDSSGLLLREVDINEMPVGYRFTQIGIIEITRNGIN